MDKSCANHPESMALATCKACDKSVCLMCVVDEKEGTFCSTECHAAFVAGTPVPKFAGAAVDSSAGSGVRKIDSIFDDEPAAPSGDQGGLPTPPDESMPIVAEGTKWRPIGAQCDNHSDTPAVANCDRCGKPVCALCLLEASQGTFCSSECMSAQTEQAPEPAAPAPSRSPAAAPAKRPLASSAPAERAALQGKPVFKFKKPKETNKAGIIAAAVFLLAVAALGGYWGWNAFSPSTDYTHDPVVVNPHPTPDPVKPDPVTPDPIKPDPVKPDPVKPDPVKPVKPDPVKPDPVKPPPVDPGPVRPRIKPPPKPVAVPTRSVNAWADVEAGTWYRLRTVRGSQVSYTDTGLKEKGKDFAVVVSQTFTNGQASAITETRVMPATVYIRGEETLPFESQTFLCEIRTPSLDESAPKTWTLVTGKNQGAPLKSQGPDGTVTAKRVWEHTLRVNHRAIDCIVVEAQVQNGSSTRMMKSWYSGEIPLGQIQREMDGESVTLFDLGNDWANRPAFPK